MRNLIGLLVVGLLGLPSTLAHAATLESPAPRANVSGLGYIAGWKCHHGEVTVRIDGGGPIRLATRMPRADTQATCQGATDNGFITQFNWAFLADGSHTVVAYDNGVEFARSTFTVATFGEEFVVGARSECTIPDFPSPGETARFVWNESTQHPELVGGIPPLCEPYTHNLDSIAGFDTHGYPAPMISTVAGRTALDLNGDGCYDSGVVFNAPEAVFPITEGLEISLEFYMNTNRYHAHWLSVAMVATDYRPDSAPVGADGCSDPRDRAPAGDSYRLFNLGPQTTTDRMRVGPAFVGGSPDVASVAYNQAGWNHLRLKILSDRRIEVWLNQRRLGIVEHTRAQAGYGREGYVWIAGRSATDPVLVDNLSVDGGCEEEDPEQEVLLGRSGEVRVNIEWDADVDLDLYVTNPCGQTFGYSEQTTATCQGSAGEWDYDDQGDGYRNDDPHAENIVWVENAPQGSYRVALNYFDGSVSTNYTIRVFYGEESRTYTGRIGPADEGTRRYIADFQFNARQ